MELIRNLIEWFADDAGSTLATLFPYLLLGLLGLYILWLVIGYLRVSQIGIAEGRGAQQALALTGGADAPAPPRGLPYCDVDNLAFPADARFCPKCERDLLVECGTCGATLSAADASCYRCGTPVGAVDSADPH